IRKRISERKPFPTTKEETIRTWEEEWDVISVEVTNKFIEALPRRLKECAAQKGRNPFRR
ncbi:hypothetical protein K440DRAFT_535802, partial [Wilcoxina mikolae CBS 423.85]